MNENITNLVMDILKHGDPSLDVLCELLLSMFKVERKEIQLIIQRGFDSGFWRLDENLKLTRGIQKWHYGE